MGAHHGNTGYLILVAIWQAMMLAMMTPVVWPWLAAYARFVAVPAPVARRAVLTASFGGGYFSAWLAYSAAAAALQWLGARVPGIAAGSRLDAIVLAAAGLYQFAPLKRACLLHCRNPLTYFLRRWHDGPAGGFRLGLGHGVFCVGCCWALMLTMIVVGVTSVMWMLALAAVAFVEQVVPGGHRLRMPIGVALLALSIRAAIVP